MMVAGTEKNSRLSFSAEVMHHSGGTKQSSTARIRKNQIRP